MKSYRLTEVKSYNVPFVRLPRPVFWFNDPFEAGTWSDLHRHEHWGELAFMRSGYMVICTELGNYAAPPQRAVWIPPGLTHEWYIPEPSVDNALYIMPHVLPPGPRFQRYHAMEVSPLVRELIHALAPQPCDYEEPGPVARMVSVLLDQLPLLPEVGFPLPMPRDRRLVALCTALLNEPDSPETIREWCTRLGMSERTLARLFQRQTGESFGRWRQRIRLHHARAQLEAGKASPPWPSTAATPPFPRSSPPSRNSSGARRANSPADAHAAFPPLRHNHLPRPYPKAAVIPPPPRRHHLRALVSQ